MEYKDKIAFIGGYVDAAIWTGTYVDEGNGAEGEADSIVTYADFPRDHPEAYAAIVAEAATVLGILQIGTELALYEAEREGGWDYVGHDALLTVQCHGTGLWDRGISVGRSLANRIDGLPEKSLRVEVNRDGEVIGAYYE